MPTARPVDPSAAALVREAIAASGLTASDFAADVVVRSEVQLYRWLRGERQPPREVMAKLRRLIAAA